MWIPTCLSHGASTRGGQSNLRLRHTAKELSLRQSHRVVLETLLPSGSHATLTRGLFETGFDDFYNRFCASAGLELQQAFRAGLFAAVWISPLLIWRVPPITMYRLEVRERALEALAGTRWYLLRQVFQAVKTVVALGYGADPSVRSVLVSGRPWP